MPRIAMLLAAVVLCAAPLTAPTAWAASSGSSNSSSSSSANSEWRTARQLIAAREYQAAIPHLLKTVEANPKNADAFNYLGYSHARTGKADEALGYYRKALAIDPKHKGANEYLGELHLMQGDLAAAEKRLAVLDDACTFGCAEFDLLQKAVARYKKSGKYVTSKGF